VSFEKRVTKQFTQKEENLLRRYIFTNPYGDISFIYPDHPLLAGEELSSLLAAYSRTHIPMQDRTLMFLAEKKYHESKEALEFIRHHMGVFRNLDGSLKVSKKARNFTNRWILKHGHNSIKEITSLFGMMENYSGIVLDYLRGHPLAKPQVKSTRYLDFATELNLSLEDEDLAVLPGTLRDECINHIKYMNSQYLKFTEFLCEKIRNHFWTKEAIDYELNQGKNDDFDKEEWIENSIKQFVLDRSRMYLLPIVRNSQGFHIDGRTIEDVINSMISSSSQEAVVAGNKLWDEAKKIAPVLLGERSHIKPNEWEKYKHSDFRDFVESSYAKDIFTTSENNGNIHIITPKEIAKYGLDTLNAAQAIFPHLDSSFLECVDLISDESKAKEIIDKIHEHRTKFDGLDQNMAHLYPLTEILMPIHAYRDIYRHRKGSRSMQLYSTRNGFEVPKIFKEFNLEEEYVHDMQEAAKLYEKVRAVDPNLAEKFVPWSFNVRAIHSWDAHQQEYIANLRTDIAKGNVTYVNLIRKMVDKLSEVMPLTVEHFRHKTDEYPEHLWKAGYNWWNDVGKDKYAA